MMLLSLESIIQPTDEWVPPIYHWKLKCPECDCENMHFLSISVLRKKDRTTVSSEGIFIEKAKNDMRGFRITVEYHCKSAVEVPLKPALLCRTNSRLYKKLEKIAELVNVEVEEFVSKIFETALNDKEFVAEAIKELRGTK